MAGRLAVCALLAAAVTWGLLSVMGALIQMGGGRTRDPVRGQVVDFVRLRKESELDLKKRRLPDRRPPKEEPPPPELDLARAEAPPQPGLATIAIPMDLHVDLEGSLHLGASLGDREAIPVVPVSPRYPSRALSRGLEGWVRVGFTVTKTGAVKDAVVEDSSPPGVFDSAALRAARKSKWKPMVVDGETVEMRSHFTYSFEVPDA